MGNGFDAVTSGGNANDCQGHGTHVAGTVGGSTYGVAKAVTIHPVRVLGCNGTGSNSGVIAGMDWVAQNHVKPAVANMSLGGGASQATDDAVTRMHNAGVTVVVAAGNNGGDACQNLACACARGHYCRFHQQQRWTFDLQLQALPTGASCLDLFAPGSSITVGLAFPAALSTNTISGTSMAIAARGRRGRAVPRQQPVGDPGAGDPGDHRRDDAEQGHGSQDGLAEPPAVLPVRQHPSATAGRDGRAQRQPAVGVDRQLVVDVHRRPSQPARPGWSSTSPAVPAMPTCTSVPVRRRPPPAYTCRPYLSGNTETCTIDNPTAGTTYYIGVHAYSSFSGVNMKATRTP